MKQPIRYFSIGLIIASLALFVVYEFFDQPKADTENLDDETLISMVEDHGYHVMEESEYIRLSVLQDNIDEDDEDEDNEKDENNKDTNEDSNENEGQADDEEDEIDNEDNDNQENDNEDNEAEESATEYSIKIDPDMLPSDVSELLEQENIINDASDFNEFLEDQDYSRLIQIGTFDVSSDMTQEEVAQVITRSN